MVSYRVLGICGSLRVASYNAALLRAAVAVRPEGMEIEVYDGLRNLPHYDGDLDVPGGRPTPAAELRRLVEAVDGILLVTPEYSCTMPGVLKNALDWLGATPVAPDERIPLAGKPVALAGASPGAFGTIRAQHALRQVLFDIRSDVVARPEVTVFACHERFADDGQLTDATTEQLLRDLLRALADTIAKGRSDDDIPVLTGAGAERQAS